MFYQVHISKRLRVRHKYFRAATGQAIGYYGDGRIRVMWDIPDTFLAPRCNSKNLVFRVKAPCKS